MLKQKASQTIITIRKRYLEPAQESFGESIFLLYVVIKECPPSDKVFTSDKLADFAARTKDAANEATPLFSQVTTMRKNMPAFTSLLASVSKILRVIAEIDMKFRQQEQPQMLKVQKLLDDAYKKQLTAKDLLDELSELSRNNPKKGILEYP